MSTLAFLVFLSTTAAGLTPRALWDAWPSARFVRTPAPCLKHSELVEHLRSLGVKHRGRLKLEEAGRSFEGRSIHLLTLGAGTRRILLWSQMHGDEPSATPALLDVADLLLSRSDQPWARRILEGATLLMVPMLNPDGAERYHRRNAQAIDVNRDALNLATPEGALLKALRDRYQPELGFNLHDQNRRSTVGDTGVLATVSLLAVAGDPKGTVTPGRRRAKRACSALATVLAPFVPDGIARYDEDWSPRAFGDNLTKWGTAVVLIESGGIPAGLGPGDLTRLNFVGLLAVLHGLVEDDLARFPPGSYEGLKRNSGTWADVVLRGGRVLRWGDPAPYRADVAFDVLVSDAERAGCMGAGRGKSRIVDLGDARFLAAGRSVEAAGKVLAPGLVATVRGLDARGWLTASVLEDLGRLGVATVRWRVEDREEDGATAMARDLAGEGRPVVVPATGKADGAALELTGPPKAPRSGSLAHVLEALAGPSWRERASTAALAALAGGGQHLQVLSPDAPASFLVLRPADEAIDPERTMLESVWIDGREVRGR